jgi:hypothetical protein
MSMFAFLVGARALLLVGDLLLFFLWMRDVSIALASVCLPLIHGKGCMQMSIRRRETRVSHLSLPILRLAWPGAPGLGPVRWSPAV